MFVCVNPLTFDLTGPQSIAKTKPPFHRAHTHTHTPNNTTFHSPCLACTHSRADWECAAFSVVLVASLFVPLNSARGRAAPRHPAFVFVLSVKQHQSAFSSLVLLLSPFFLLITEPSPSKGQCFVCVPLSSERLLMVKSPPEEFGTGGI